MNYFCVIFLDEDNGLSNREMHIDYKEMKEETESSLSREDKIIDIIKSDPNITLRKDADKTGNSLRAVKTSINALREKGVSYEGARKKVVWL